MPHCQPVLVVSSRKSAYGLERAEKAGIKNCFIGKEGFEDKLLALLEEEKIDIIVLAGFLKVLSSDFVRRYPDRIINVHPSLIPSFCGEGYYGLRVHEEALRRGVKVTGATVHFVNEIPDGGRINNHLTEKIAHIYFTYGDMETMNREITGYNDRILVKLK